MTIKSRGDFMDKELQSYYETYFDLFASDGWKQYVEDVTKEADRYEIMNIASEADLKFIQGQLSVLNNVLQFETIIKNAYDSILEETDETAV